MKNKWMLQRVKHCLCGVILASILSILILHLYLALFISSDLSLSSVDPSNEKKKIDYVRIEAAYFNQIFAANEQRRKSLHKNCQIIGERNESSIYDGYPKSLPLHQNKSIDFECLNERIDRTRKAAKRILFYNNLVELKHSARMMMMMMKKKSEAKCPVSNCQITLDKRKMNSSDLILFNLNDHKLRQIPKRLNFKSVWAYLMYEPLRVANFDLGQFDWSAGYSTTQSTFTSVYNNFEWIRGGNKSRPMMRALANSHNVLIATILNQDDCIQQDYMVYLNELKRYVAVDIYGGCGQSNQMDKKRKSLEEIGKLNYKFFFAFESQLCENYLSERFFDALKFDWIPIVFKRYPDHDTHLPSRNAFISSSQFSNAKSLADFLLYINSSHNEFEKYFEWKSHVRFFNENLQADKQLTGLRSLLCDMCIKLNLNEFGLSSPSSRLERANQKPKCFKLTWKSVLAFYYSEPYKEPTFWQNLLNFFLH